MLNLTNSKKAANNNIIYIFISHSVLDKKIVNLLIEMLRLALNISARKIRCTSISGHKLSAGVFQDEQLRADIANSKVFICIITPKSNESDYVAFEMGARWGSNQPLIPFIACKSGISLLKGPLKNIHALNGGKKDDIFQLINELATYLDIDPEEPSVYSDKVEKLARLILLN